MNKDYYLAIDVGTGSARAALVNRDGKIIDIASKEHEQHVPQYGWAEQAPADWWQGVRLSVQALMERHPDAASRIAAICACGQMHGTVLLDAQGELVSTTVMLWNDKRTTPQVRDFEKRFAPSVYLQDSGNPATPAWPGFKLQWLRDNQPEALARTVVVLMPKDYINFRLTGELAQDRTEASCSFMMDPATGDWSGAMLDRLGIRADLLPPIRQAGEVLGALLPATAQALGLQAGTPVLVGGGDYPMALLGSGVSRPGLGSDVTGTSCIITTITPQPLLDPEISNVATCTGDWGPFVLLETGGDGMRWARRALHENKLSYAEINAFAETAPPGSRGLFFLPYLTGERLGEHRNARAQYFGLAANHRLPELHRAVMEGVAFAAARHISVMEQATGQKLERIVASSGGARSALWLKIKASIYGVPVVVPEEAECSVLGCAALAAAAVGHADTPQSAAERFVKYSEEVHPDPAWQAVYQKMQPIFNQLYFNSQALYDQLDELALGGH
ncbi:xylulokinase [[Erwinia] mediterraneensis]|uniref:xylulokinase n=1 Tax=[Erwinia] mediterraneensis TaxID=2161819 RepID=UPI00102FFFC0|nr:FGGY family carbohydrate kinase [[Erwinia] mediterraneensis]